MTRSQALNDPAAPSRDRRSLLRGGAVLAATAGVAAVAAAVPAPARAADGDPLELGAENASETSTTITQGAEIGGPEPTLALNNADGPSLYLQPLDFESGPEIQLGEIVNTQLGPVMGVDSFVGLTNAYLVTSVDLADLPTPLALRTPVRLLDTRSAASRVTVLRSSTSPTAAVFDAAGRMKAGAWIDVEIAAEEVGTDIPSAYLNVTAVGPLAAGYLTVYPPGDRPETSTLNYQPSVTIANQAFVATGIVRGRFAVRIFSTQVTHVAMDLTGVTIKGTAPTPVAAGQNQQQRTSKRQASDPKRAASVTSRLRSTLADRVRKSLSSR